MRPVIGAFGVAVERQCQWPGPIEFGGHCGPPGQVLLCVCRGQYRQHVNNVAGIISGQRNRNITIKPQVIAGWLGGVTTAWKIHGTPNGQIVQVFNIVNTAIAIGWWNRRRHDNPIVHLQCRYISAEEFYRMFTMSDWSLLHGGNMDGDQR